MNSCKQEGAAVAADAGPGLAPGRGARPEEARPRFRQGSFPLSVKLRKTGKVPLSPTFPTFQG